MKLVGEYELHDWGVKIEGRINDSHIHEVRSLLEPFRTIRILKGDTEMLSQAYYVPHPQYRPYIIRNVPGICTPDREREFVLLPQRVESDLEMYYNDASIFAANMGVTYQDSDGQAIMDHRRVFQYVRKSREQMRLVTNSAWVWGADERGNFSVEIFGIVNRHMMTVVLANAAKMAKYIDTVLVRALDKADEFTPAKVEERAEARRQLIQWW